VLTVLKDQIVDERKEPTGQGSPADALAVKRIREVVKDVGGFEHQGRPSSPDTPSTPRFRRLGRPPRDHFHPHPDLHFTSRVVKLSTMYFAATPKEDRRP
jgi:hypothetical protein